MDVADLQKACAAAALITAAEVRLFLTGKRAAEDMGALKRIAIAATRVAVEPRAAIMIARTNLRQAASADPVTARHALGLGIHAARKVSRAAPMCDPQVSAFRPCDAGRCKAELLYFYMVQDARLVMDALSDLVLDAVQLYEMAGAAAFAPKKPVKGASPVSEDGINLSDPFTRVYMARLCAALVFSERAGAGLSGVAASYYQMLTLLATRSVSLLLSDNVHDASALPRRVSSVLCPEASDR